MSLPILTFTALVNYTPNLTAGTVLERASVQSIFGRVNDQLIHDFAGQELTLTIKRLSRDSDGNMRGAAKDDEIYTLNDSKAAALRHLHLTDANGNQVRSIVLALTELVATELFGEINDEKVFSCPVAENLLGVIGEASSIFKATNEFSYPMHEGLLLYPDNKWYVLVRFFGEEGKDPQVEKRLATAAELKAAGISQDFPIKIAIDFSNGAPNKFTDDKGVWQIVTGAKLVNTDKGGTAYVLDYRACTQAEIPVVPAGDPAAETTKVAAPTVATSEKK
jgi:hypothetical protein